MTRLQNIRRSTHTDYEIAIKELVKEYGGCYSDVICIDWNMTVLEFITYFFNCDESCFDI